MKKAPISAAERKQLSADAQNIRAAAARKDLILTVLDEVQETEAANQHFELGCWLYFYRDRVSHDGITGLNARVGCLKLLFEAGIYNPRYSFFTVFDFGERQFDTIFEMGDSAAVIQKLRACLASDKSGQIAQGFDYYKWPLDIPIELTMAQAMSQQDIPSLNLSLF